MDFEADDKFACDSWYNALAAHAEVADEQSMGEFKINSCVHHYSSNGFQDEVSISDDQRSELSAMSSLGSWSSFGSNRSHGRRRCVTVHISPFSNILLLVFTVRCVAYGMEFVQSISARKLWRGNIDGRRGE